MTKMKILVADDEDIVRNALKDWLEQAGYEVVLAADGREAVKLIEQHALSVAILDLKMPELDGIEVLRHARKLNPAFDAIFVTAYASVESAVIAMKEGAFDYVEKPFCPERVELLVKKCVEHQTLLQENAELKKELERRVAFHDIIGRSRAMQRVFEMIRAVANSSVTVLIQGETGTGKELVARAVHCESNRKNDPFVAISCVNIPESLLESELFGHEKGAFTGAVQQRHGKFEHADNGTLFLDEIGDISPGIQMRLLRVLDEKEFNRVGGNENIKVDVRIISATNRDLKKLVGQGQFREDLFFRLKVFAITLPALRERKEDIPLLAHHFLEKFRRENKKDVREFSPDAMQCLMKYHWPGNVRELENFVQYAAVVCADSCITAENLPGIDPEHVPKSATQCLKEVERDHILSILHQTHFNLSRTAEILGITRTTLYKKMRDYDINKCDDATST